MKKITSFFIFLLIFGLGYAGAVDYPKPYGHVNDFAHLLPVSTVQKLETELRAYKAQTSIEVAVVTVKSLEDLSIEEYAIELATRWGVGEKKKDNGVVLLVAPNERKVRIEVGYGLEPDLTDAQSSRIIRDSILPLFKEGKMAEGIVAGVGDIVAALGAAPYEAREEERRVKAEKERAESEQKKAAFIGFLWVVLPVLFVMFVCTAVIFFIRRFAEWRRRLQALQNQNYTKLCKVCADIIKIENDYEPVLAALDALKKENPKEIWEGLEGKVRAIPANLKMLKKKQADALKVYEQGWRCAEEAERIILPLNIDATAGSSVYELVKAKNEEVAKAREASCAYSASLPNLFKTAEEALNYPDVLDKARLTLRKARSQYSDACRLYLVPAKLTNWLLAYSLCSAASSLAKEAVELAVADKKNAERARSEGPKLLRELPEYIKKAESAVSDSDVSFSTKGKVNAAKAKYANAKSLAGSTPADWPAIFILLTAAAEFLKTAVSNAASEKDVAASVCRRRREESSSGVYSVGSGSGLSIGGGDGFSGFSGGDFGGGGASGSW